jgi:hypothetical protein
MIATAGRARERQRTATAPPGARRNPAVNSHMAAKLRHVIIAARFKASRPDQPAPEEISTLRLAWEDFAA